MKRSKSLKLGLMVAAGTGLSACDDAAEDVTGTFYQNAEQCIQANLFDSADCTQAFDEALSLNQESGPKFEDQSLCEAEFGLGQCQQSEGGNFWAPFIAGYFMAEIIDEVGDVLEAKYKKKKYGSHTRPIYRSKAGNGFYSPSGAQIYRDKNGQVRIQKQALAKKPAASKVATKRSIAARGGFSSRSSSRSRGG